MRALIAIRLSRLTDESTSVERQREACERLCRDRGYDVVGEAEDTDVSAGKTSPFERPSLGSWLAAPEKFDVLVVWKADRLVRSARHLGDFLEWAEKHSVALVAADEAHVDTTANAGPFSTIFLQLTSMFAEMELQSIRDRTYSSYQHRSEQGLSTGSLTLYGYRTVRDEQGEARVETDPPAAEIVREIAERILAGSSQAAIADDLNERGILSPRDRGRVRQGKAPKGARWAESTLNRLLRNPGLQGYITYRERLLDAHGKPRRASDGSYVYGPLQTRRKADGSPVQRAEPVLVPSQWRRLQAELDYRNAKYERKNKKSDSMLLQVLFCGVCGDQPMYRLRQKDGPDRYRCRTASDYRKQTCENGSVLVSDADELIENVVLGAVGDSFRQERFWEPGEDIEAEVEEVSELLEDLTDQLGTGLFKKGSPQRARLEENIAANSARLDQLKAAPPSEGGWRYEPTNEKFRDWWQTLGTVEKNQFLRDTGVSSRMSRKKGKSAPDPDWAIELGNIREMVAGFTVAPTSMAAAAIAAGDIKIPAGTAAGSMELLPGVELHWPDVE